MEIPSVTNAVEWIETRCPILNIQVFRSLFYCLITDRNPRATGGVDGRLEVGQTRHVIKKFFYATHAGI